MPRKIKIDVRRGRCAGQAQALVEQARACRRRAGEFVATPEEAGEWLARENARRRRLFLLKGFGGGVKLERAIGGLAGAARDGQKLRLRRRFGGLIALLAAVFEAATLFSFSIPPFPHLPLPLTFPHRFLPVLHRAVYRAYRWSPLVIGRPA